MKNDDLAREWTSETYNGLKYFLMSISTKYIQFLHFIEAYFKIISDSRKTVLHYQWILHLTALIINLRAAPTNNAISIFESLLYISDRCLILQSVSA